MKTQSGMDNALKAQCLDLLGVAVPDGQFEPGAYYHKGMDYVDYLTVDDVTVSDRIDKFLTLYWDYDQTKVVGFKMKGFQCVYNTHLKSIFRNTQWVDLAKSLEVIISLMGNEFLEDANRRFAYEQAKTIALAGHAKIKFAEAA